MNKISEEEFEAKYNLYSQELMNICYGYTRNRDDSLDIIQNVFLKLFNNRKIFSSQFDEKYWLIRVTINECKDLLRKKSRLVYLDEDTINLIPNENNDEETYDLHLLSQKVAKLNEKYRVVVILFYYDSLSIKEISQTLKISESAVKKRLERARNLLRKEMEKWYMLDKIKRIIPKMEKEDADIIYNNITKEKTKRYFSKKPILLVTTIIILIIPLSVILFRDNNIKDEGNFIEPNEQNKIPENQSQHPKTFNEISLLGMAAFSEFDKKENLALNSVSQNNDIIFLGENDYLKVSYPYDYIKIIEAYKFDIDITGITEAEGKTILESNCGVGKLEVVVASFETYEENEGVMTPLIADTLISLRGYNGYYTILVNSITYQSDDYQNDKCLMVFSSHKKLNSDEVSKDFTPPILSIILEEENDNRYLYFKTSDKLIGDSDYIKEETYKNTSELENVSRSTLYDVMELTKLPTKIISASILEIDYENGIIKVNTDYLTETDTDGEYFAESNSVKITTNLEYVYYSIEDEIINNLNVGDIIIIEYDYLFDNYNPSNVIANVINKK